MKQIKFPKRELNMIQKYLKEGECSTVRCCNEIDKYKVGEIYQTPWGDLIKILKVKRYSDVSKIPTFDQMDKTMKISLNSGDQWDFIIFKLK